MMTAPKPTRMMAPDQMARLNAWNARKPVIAIMGEFSAGKSTLLNMLIGQSILPTQITATKLPPVWLRYGDEAPYRVDRNNMRHPIDLNDLSAVPIKDTRYIRIFCQAEVLESCDLLDTPGISDPNIPMTMWIRTIGYANAVLWCSHAGQAWRESERAAWESLPERLRLHSLLLVTRSDKIVSEIDRMKIDTRLRRETETLFGGRLFISLTNALRALEGEGDADMWAASGAETFVEMLAGSIAAINDDRTAAIRRYRLDPTNVPRVLPRRVRPISADLASLMDAADPSALGGSVVPIRPMRVVASNEDPVGSVPSDLRAALREVPMPEEARHAPLILDDLVDKEAEFVAEPQVEDDLPEATVAEVEDAPFVAEPMMEDDLPEMAVAEEEDPFVAELAMEDDLPEAAVAEVEDAPFVAEPMMEDDLPDAAVAEVEDEPFVAEPMMEDDLPQATAAEVEDAPVLAERVMDDDLPEIAIAEVADAPSLAEPSMEDDLPEAEVAEFVAEPAMDDTLPEMWDDATPAPEDLPMAVTADADAETPDAEDTIAAVMAGFAQPEAEAEVTPDAEQAVASETHEIADTATADDAALHDTDAEDTIAAMMAGLALPGAEEEQPEDEQSSPMAEVTPLHALPPAAMDTDAPEDVEAEVAEAGPAPMTASALWHDVLAARQVTSVQDLVQAMTDFIAQLDAAGVMILRGDMGADDDGAPHTSDRAERRMAAGRGWKRRRG
jgi:Dynamin family